MPQLQGYCTGRSGHETAFVVHSNPTLAVLRIIDSQERARLRSPTQPAPRTSTSQVLQLWNCLVEGHSHTMWALWDYALVVLFVVFVYGFLYALTLPRRKPLHSHTL